MTATIPPRPAAANRAEYLGEVAGQLWPAPATVRIGARRQARPDAAETYLIVPDARQPRLILPRSGRAAAAAVAGFNPDRSPRAAALSGLLRLSLRAGVARWLLPDRLTVSGAGESLGSHLAQVLGQEVTVSVLIGPPRANAKPVAQLLSRDGEVLGYVKVGATGLASALVRAEAAALTRLAAAGTRTVTIPAVLHAGRWRDIEILVLSPLRAAGRPPRRGAAGLLQAATAEVAAIAGLDRAPLAGSPYWLGLLRRLGALGERGAAFTALAGRVGARSGSAVLTFGSWHGDWTRTNVTVRQDTVLAWDWERFETGVPAGFDALHYQLHHLINSSGRDAAAAVSDCFAAAAQLVGPVAAGPQPAALACALYFLELAVRYLHDRQDLAGARLGRPDIWMLPALTTAVETLP
ncbi:MAG TPA: hypothetical protein VH637_12970 [Streptosporangiaceae bacterium]|jgi:hypothetical protein